MESMEQVVHTYADMVYRLAYAHTRSPADADDIFQEVFLAYAERQFRKAPAFTDEEHRKAWLIRVTLNRCRSHWRILKRRRIVPLHEARHAAAPPPADPVLDEALSRLPARYRRVIHLHYFENYNTGEIARLTGQRPSTVRAQLTRARRLLAELQKGESDHDATLPTDE